MPPGSTLVNQLTNLLCRKWRLLLAWPPLISTPAVNVKSSPTASKSGVAAHAREWSDYSSAAAASVAPPLNSSLPRRLQVLAPYFDLHPAGIAEYISLSAEKGGLTVETTLNLLAEVAEKAVKETVASNGGGKL